MVTLIIIVFGILLALTATVAYLFLRVQDGRNANRVTDNLTALSALDWKAKWLIAIAMLLVLFSFFSPFLFTRQSATDAFDFSKTGEIGDTVSGLMNPFIAISGVVITGLAFYIQYRANQQQREMFVQQIEKSELHFQTQLEAQNNQIKLQQFESQFYEMLRLHRENIDETKISGYDFEEHKSELNRDYELRRVEKVTEGRKVFVTMKTEFECILSIYCEDAKLTKRGFEKCYELFFHGIEWFQKKYSEEKTFIGKLWKARDQHQNRNGNLKTNDERKSYSSTKLKFNYKPFSGHASHLGHYFRHLYMTVKSVVHSKTIVDYEERMKYLRLLRAQLSNHEQILLFYNWLGGFGIEWENKENRFFTEYCIIHNLWYHGLYESEYIESTLDNLQNLATTLRKGPMFEID